MQSADGEEEPDMRQAIEEGFILDVLTNYTSYKSSGAAAVGGFIKTALTLLPIALILWVVEARRSREERKSARPGRKRTKTSRKTGKEKSADVLRAKNQAESLLKETKVRQLICPALQSGVNDVYDIAKRIIPFAMTGAIAIPVDPLSYAMLALLIARVGVASLCRGLKSKEESASADE